MEIVDGKLGTVGKYDVSLSGGNLTFTVDASADGMTEAESFIVPAEELIVGLLLPKIYGILPKGAIETEVESVITSGVTAWFAKS